MNLNKSALRAIRGQYIMDNYINDISAARSKYPLRLRQLSCLSLSSPKSCMRNISDTIGDYTKRFPFHELIIN